MGKITTEDLKDKDMEVRSRRTGQRDYGHKREKEKGEKIMSRGERVKKRTEIDFLICFFHQFLDLSPPQNRARDLQLLF